MNWWPWLRRKLIINELFHQPDEYIFCQFLKAYREAPREETNRWISILSSACLICPNAEPLSFSPKKIRYPYRGDCRMASRFTYTPSNPDQFKKAVTKLSQYRSYFNTGRMGGDPPVCSIKYLQIVGRDFVRPIASWNNSGTQRSPEQIYSYVIERVPRDPRVQDGEWNQAALTSPLLSSFSGELYDILTDFDAPLVSTCNS